MIKHTYFKPSKIWDELCLFIKLKLGRVGMGQVLCGPSWFWAEMSCTLTGLTQEPDPNIVEKLLTETLKNQITQTRTRLFEGFNNITNYK